MAEQDSPSTALAEREPQQALAAPAILTDDEIQRTYRIAQAFAASSLYKDVKSAEQGFAKILVGRDLGLSPAQSLTLHVFDGRVEVPAVMLENFVRQREGYDADIFWIYPDPEKPDDKTKREAVAAPEVSLTEWRDCVGCAVRFMVGGEARGVWTWTIEDTQRAGLGGKDTHTKYPRSMFLWRAMSAGVKAYVPEVLNGIPIYVEGEIERVPNLAEGEGNGDEPGWGDVPIAAVHEVEKLIRRAERLGHAGLASRAAAQMLLVGQSHEVIRAWIDQAAHELDALQAKQPKSSDAALTEPDRGEASPGDGEPDPIVPEHGEPVREGETVTTPQSEPVLVDGGPQPEPDTSALPHETQLELAEAKLAGALNEREEREALVELQRLRGED